jgi:hypothetical protein
MGLISLSDQKCAAIVILQSGSSGRLFQDGCKVQYPNRCDIWETGGSSGEARKEKRLDDL